MQAHSPLNQYDFHKTLIIDIETVPQFDSFDKLSPLMRKHWEHKVGFLRLSAEEEDDIAAAFLRRAGIYAEFGKIVCVGLGFIVPQGDKLKLRLKSIADDDERSLLQKFCDILHSMEQSQHRDIIFCGHNIKEFDLPYICRRLLIQGLALPQSLQMGGLKPWQVPHKDTMELWRFGDYKHYTSLDLLATILGVASSKTDMDGSMVAEAYWKQGALAQISDYCLRDIHTTALVYLKLLGVDQEVEVAYT